MTIEIYQQRRQRLADKLRELPEEQWDFRFFKRTLYYDEHSCGTTFCAAGLCPTLFPEDWEFNDVSIPYLKKYRITEGHLEGLYEKGTTFDHIAEFLGMRLEDARKVFGGEESPKAYGVASRFEVNPVMVAELLLNTPYTEENA